MYNYIAFMGNMVYRSGVQPIAITINWKVASCARPSPRLTLILEFPKWEML